MASHMLERVVTNSTTTKHEFVDVSLRIEESAPKNSCRLLTCTRCGARKDRQNYTVNQFKQKNPSRICLACGLANGKYRVTDFKSVAGDGKSCVCYSCKLAVRLEDLAEHDGKPMVQLVRDGQRWRTVFYETYPRYCQDCVDGAGKPYRCSAQLWNYGKDRKEHNVYVSFCRLCFGSG